MKQSHALRDITDLLFFHRVARGMEEGQGLPEIAQDCGLSSDKMLLRRIARLGERLGGPLVSPATRWAPMTFTEKGKEVLGRIRSAVNALEAELTGGDPQYILPTLRVATNLPTLLVLPPELLKENYTNHNQLALPFRLETRSENTRKEASWKVAEKNVHFALIACLGDKAEPKLTNAKVISEIWHVTPIRAIIPKGHPLAIRWAEKNRANLADLKHQHIIARDLYREIGRIEGAGWTTPEHSEDVPYYVRAGLGVGLQTELGLKVLGIPLEGEAGIETYLLDPPVQMRIECIRRTATVQSEKVFEEYVEALKTWYESGKTLTPTRPWWDELLEGLNPVFRGFRLK
jgi:DNA-binding transcriptional LysR family regulator